MIAMVKWKMEMTVYFDGRVGVESTNCRWKEGDGHHNHLDDKKSEA